jgi:hypothetical protein
VVAALAGATLASQQPSPARAALIARAKSLELNTPYVPPPGDALEHHTAGFAKIMCSNVFMTGLAPDLEHAGHRRADHDLAGGRLLIRFFLENGRGSAGDAPVSFPK